jgi:hypothetical protein
MDLLIGERQHLSINSTKDLSEYHLQFIAITTWLISKGQLGNLEQQRAYIRAFQLPLLSAIMNCLQFKNADHHSNVPHKVEAVYEAACFVLHDTTCPKCVNLLVSKCNRDTHLIPSFIPFAYFLLWPITLIDLS